MNQRYLNVDINILLLLITRHRAALKYSQLILLSFITRSLNRIVRINSIIDRGAITIIDFLRRLAHIPRKILSFNQPFNTGIRAKVALHFLEYFNGTRRKLRRNIDFVQVTVCRQTDIRLICHRVRTLTNP